MDHLRLLLMREPRGPRRDVRAPSCSRRLRDDADWGVLFIEVSGCLPMCGHGTIGVATVLVETGHGRGQRARDRSCGSTRPPGSWRRACAVEGGRARSVALRNVPSFLLARDRSVRRERARARATTWPSAATSTRSLPAESAGARRGPRARRRADRARARAHGRDQRRRSAPVHPADERIAGCRHVVFTAPGEDGPRSQRSATSIHPGWLDRSPCGTGTSAKLAQLHARGELGVGEEFVNRSVIGTRFGARIVGGDRGGRAAGRDAGDHRAAPGSPAWGSTCSIPRIRSRRGSRSEPGDFEVAVVGAGIVGCATAYELARRGVRVCLLEREARSRRAPPASARATCSAATRSPGPSSTSASPASPCTTRSRSCSARRRASGARARSWCMPTRRAGSAERDARGRAAGRGRRVRAARRRRRCGQPSPSCAATLLGRILVPARPPVRAARDRPRALAREAGALGAGCAHGLRGRGDRGRGRPGRGRRAAGDGERWPPTVVLIAAGTWSAPLAAQRRARAAARAAQGPARAARAPARLPAPQGDRRRLHGSAWRARTRGSR